MDDPALLEFVGPPAKAFAKLQQATGVVAQKGLKDPGEAGAASTDYLRIFALVAVGYMWARMAKCLVGKGGQASDRARFYDGKLKTARFFLDRKSTRLNSSH